MIVEGTHRFKADRQTVWRTLLDKGALTKSIPGCDKLEEVEADKFEAVMKVGVAAVKGTYKGNVLITDKKEPSHFKMAVEGSGFPGFVKGEATIKLDEASGGETFVSYKGDAKVGGLIAGVGQRMLGGIAKLIISEFFKRLEEQLPKRQ